MLNVLTKTMPWMVASLLVATSGFGQQTMDKGASRPQPKNCDVKPNCCERVCPPACPINLIPAYNHPSGIDTRCSWDVFADGSFTYWQAIQDNMEVAVSDGGDTSDSLTAGNVSAGKLVDTGFQYKPGFKVGLGFKSDYDDWDFRAGYTWFRSTDTTNVTAPAAAAAGDTPALLSLPGSPLITRGKQYTNVNSRWTVGLDLIDATMGRWFYVGTKLTFHPYAGARGAFIRQKLKNTSTGTGSVDNLNDSSNSWGVGPRMGLDMNWCLGEGFRFYDTVAADILFTQYTKTSTSESDGTLTLNVKGFDVNRLRTHIEMEMGIGWGTFLDCNNWFLDLSAGYTFQSFFDQNPFRRFTDDVAVVSSFSPNGNLYIHGLTATLALHF
jgi:hypothetical protein